ncbi:MAG: hypothetical protein DI529_15170 [Chryseobacterium sp.]|nr:MAG: hypothetical protein DI529_15170 [Chryseobacterium sp.]
MDLKNTGEQLSAQEVELLNDFQMEELEERFEMDETAGRIKWFDGSNQTPGTAQTGVSQSF